MASYYRIDTENNIVYANLLALEKCPKEKAEVDVFKSYGFALKYECIEPEKRTTTRVPYELIMTYLKDDKARTDQALEIEKVEEDKTCKNGKTRTIKKGKNGVVSWFKKNYLAEYKALKIGDTDEEKIKNAKAIKKAKAENNLNEKKS